MKQKLFAGQSYVIGSSALKKLHRSFDRLSARRESEFACSHVDFGLKMASSHTVVQVAEEKKRPVFFE